MTSVRLLLIRWIKRLSDSVSKSCVEHLRSIEGHSQAIGYTNNTVIVGINHSCTEGNVNHTFVGAHFSDDINKIDTAGIINQIPPVRTQRYFSDCPVNNLIAHKNLLHFENISQSKHSPEMNEKLRQQGPLSQRGAA